MPVQKEVSSMEAHCSSGNAAEQFLVTDWAALQSASGSTGFSSYNVGGSNIPTIERLPSFSDIMGSFGLTDGTQMASDICAQGSPSTTENGAENIRGKKRKKMPECGPLITSQNVEAEQQQNDVRIENGKSPMTNDEKKQKNETSPGANENSDAPKEDYIHIRARRGQATNSHSLAERVRREKISERMRLLQDLVPGCNKITGKALMLDEIINYVQSLQRQVEFLSMKLATVNPELDLDIDQIFAKESLHSRYGSSSAFGYCPPMAIPSLTNSRDLIRTATNPQILPMAQNQTHWESEFQNAIQMGLLPNLSHEGMEPNGSMKVEL